MSLYLCECTACGWQRNIRFDDPHPSLGDAFPCYCNCCQEETIFIRTVIRKAQAEMNRIAEENALQEAIRDKCAALGFDCRFYLEFVIITTPVARWQFDYHQKLKTLRHESTVKVNFETWDPAAMHYQFRDRKMSWMDVLFRPLFPAIRNHFLRPCTQCAHYTRKSAILQRFQDFPILPCKPLKPSCLGQVFHPRFLQWLTSRNLNGG